MRSFLDGFISSLGRAGQRRVGYVLSDAKADKNSAQLLAERLATSIITQSFVIEEHREGGKVSPGLVAQMFGAAQQNLNQLYDLSNTISDLQSTTSQVLAGDLNEMNEEISALEKAIENYAFLLSDGRTFDTAYIEKFSDELGRGSLPFKIPDRTGSPFEDWEMAWVDQEEGALKMSSVLSGPTSITARVLASNCSQFIRYGTKPQNAVKSTPSRGWMVKVAALAPITSGLSYENITDLTTGGAQYVLEFAFNRPSSIDTIELHPLAETRTQVLGIYLFDDITGTPSENLVSSPFYLSQRYAFSFPLRTVAKAWVVLRAEEYKRTLLSAAVEERRMENLEFLGGSPETLAALGLLEDGTDAPGDTQPSDWVGGEIPAPPTVPAAKPTIYFWDKIDNSHLKGLFAPEPPTPNRLDWGSRIKSRRHTEPLVPAAIVWKNQPKVATIMQESLQQFLQDRSLSSILVPETYQIGTTSKPEPAGGGFDQEYRSTNQGALSTAVATGDDNVLELMDRPLGYNYTLGLRNIRFGTSASGFRAAFVSKPIPASGNMGEVRLRKKDTHQESTDLTRDVSRITSVEYSVSNKSLPSLESDWVPIVPVEDREVIGERLFPGTVGEAYLRFPADPTRNIAIYRNGKLFLPRPINEMFIWNEARDSIRGFSIPQTELAPQDIFQASYFPKEGLDIVSFNDSSAIEVALVSAFDADGAGEGFTNVGTQLTVTLSNDPYIDYGQVSSATYNVTTGLSGYSPITVLLEDGTTAYNLTNYKGGTQSVLNASSANYEYLHNGRSLIFNKVIPQSFRVYYQYSPNDLRFRVVLRANDNNFVTPKVDSVQIKGKTIKSDAKRRL